MKRVKYIKHENAVKDLYFEYLESDLLKVRYDVAASLINPKLGIIEIGPQGDNRIKNWFSDIKVFEFTEDKYNFNDWKELIDVDEWDCLVWLGVNIRNFKIKDFPKYLTNNKQVEYGFELLDSMNEVVIEGYLDSPRQEYDRVRKFISDSFNNVEEIKWDFIQKNTFEGLEGIVKLSQIKRYRNYTYLN